MVGIKGIVVINNIIISIIEVISIMVDEIIMANIIIRSVDCCFNHIIMIKQYLLFN